MPQNDYDSLETPEDFARAREEIRRQREALALVTDDELSQVTEYVARADEGYGDRPPGGVEALEAVQALPLDPDGGPEGPQDAAEDDTPPPWPHQTMTYGDQEWEVRLPDQSALMAVSMITGGGIAPDLQMRVFRKFLSAHCSEESFARVLEGLMDAESGVTLTGFIKTLTTLAMEGVQAG